MLNSDVAEKRLQWWWVERARVSMNLWSDLVYVLAFAACTLPSLKAVFFNPTAHQNRVYR